MAPVMRKMLRFNHLDYYTVPTLPPAWKAPTWLTIQLGIFAGRLYFEYGEYDALREYLGLQDITSKLTDPSCDTVPQHRLGLKDGADSDAITTMETVPRSFTAKPLTFLQEWLAIRRKGQDFAQTPMGYVCQGKPLAASHPFFFRMMGKGEGVGMRVDRNC